MTDADKLVDKFAGFITREQAERILKGESTTEPKVQKGSASKGSISVKELLNTLKTDANAAKTLREASEESNQLVNIKDHIYRIFNPTNASINGREVIKRTIILGEEGSTIRFNLKGNISEFIDINGFERGDLVSIGNAIIDPLSAEIKSGQNTVINRISPSKRVAITNFSSIKEELKKVDAIGRIMEIGTIRHVNRLGGGGQIAVASCTITDGHTNIDASLWGSSALKTATMKTNDFLKLEFCDFKMRDDKFQIYANDYSRVVTGNAFANRIQKGR